MNKLELLSKLGEVKISKKGNYFVILEENKHVSTYTYSPFSITKNTCKKIGETNTYPNNFNKVILLTKDSKLKFKKDKVFNNLSFKDVLNHSQLKEIFLYGKKCEFLKNYDKEYLKYFNFLKSFSSFKQVKNFLGYNFLNVDDFLLLDFYHVLQFSFLEASHAINFVKHEESYTLYLDSKAMAGDAFIMPKTYNKLKKYHQELIDLKNLENLSSKSKEEIYFSHIIDNFKYEDVYFKRLLSEYDMHKESIEMNNCVSSKSYLLNKYVFLSIFYKNIRHTCQLDSNYILEIKTKHNNPADQNLIKILNSYIKAHEPVF